MQQDQPLYEEMVRRGSRGRWFWRIGSWLYLAGLGGLVAILIAWPLGFYFKISDVWLLFFLALVLMAGLVTLGTFLKKISYRIALDEGMDISEYFRDTDAGKR